MLVATRFFLLCAVVLGPPAISCPAALAFPIADPGAEGLEVIVSSTDPVVATYQGNSALYSNNLYLMLDGAGQPGDDGNPANDRFIFNNHTSPVGSTVDLGSFPVGTALIFRLHVNDTGQDYFTGHQSRNPDNQPHARAQADWVPNETLVSFEDLFNGPFDYNDLSFSFVPTTAAQPTVSSTEGWQQMGLYLQQGDTFKIGYIYGTWTVDYRYFKSVDPSGYPPDIDQQIYQGCKTVSSLPYGTLLGKIGDGPIFLAGKGTETGWFTANATGQLYLRINDNEACHGDNKGEIAVMIAKEHVNLADNINPGGTWIEPSDNFFVTEPRLKLSARVSDNPGGSGIAKVNFTAWWPGEGDKVWHVICPQNKPKPGTTDVYECEWDLTWVPNGDARVSFDVYDKAENRKLAPNGIRKGAIQKETPPVAEGFKCTFLLGCAFRINHQHTQELIKIFQAAGAPGVIEYDALVPVCMSIMVGGGLFPPPWVCPLFAAGLVIGLPLTEEWLKLADSGGDGVVLYFFLGTKPIILPPALSPVK